MMRLHLVMQLLYASPAPKASQDVSLRREDQTQLVSQPASQPASQSAAEMYLQQLHRLQVQSQMRSAILQK